jgi:hypothetical protein
MAATWTQADVDNLKAVIASGAQTVTYSGPNGRSITYQGVDKLRALLAEMIADVAAQGGTARVRYRRVKTSKGLSDE